MRIYQQLGCLLVLFGLMACGGRPATNTPPATSAPSMTPTLAPTQVFTETPASPTATPTQSSTGTPAFTPTSVHTATVTSKPASGAVTKDTTIIFISETIPDGTKLNPDQTFTKTWTLKNGGTLPWTTGYTLAVISSNPVDQTLNAPASVPLAHAVNPGEEIEISVDLVAPSQDGLYTLTWQLCNDRGAWVYGSEIWVTIRVGEAAAAESATSENVTANLLSAASQQGEVTVNFCMQLPDERAWYPWDVSLAVGAQSYTPNGSFIDPATATTAYKCFSYSYTTGSAVASGDSYQLSIGNVSLPPEVNLEENCAYARQVLTVTYPGMDFTCGGAGFFYTNLVLPPGMTVEQADKLILDLMSSAIYGPWVLSGVIP